MTAGELLRWQFRLAHRLLDATVQGLQDEAVPGGHPSRLLVPAGTCFARALLHEDLIVNGVLASRRPLALSSWSGRTGLSAVPVLASNADWASWARHVRFDLGQLRRYAGAVYDATETYLADLPDEALDTAGGTTPACLLSALLVTICTRRGEIAHLLPR